MVDIGIDYTKFFKKGQLQHLIDSGIVLLEREHWLELLKEIAEIYENFLKNGQVFDVITILGRIEITASTIEKDEYQTIGDWLEEYSGETVSGKPIAYADIIQNVIEEFLDVKIMELNNYDDIHELEDSVNDYSFLTYISWAVIDYIYRLNIDVLKMS